MSYPTWDNLYDPHNPGSYLMAAAIFQGLYPGAGPIDPYLEQDPLVQDLRRFQASMTPMPSERFRKRRG